MMRWLLFCIASALLLLSGCLSSAKYLEQTKFCEKVKDKLNMEFEMYGMFLMPATTVGDLHYCEFFLGPQKALKILYSDESDPERAFVTSLQSTKANSIADGYQITGIETGSDGDNELFTVSLKKPLTGEKKTVVYVVGGSSSITVSASYLPGLPNPFVEPKLLQKIAVSSLQLANP